MAKEPRKRGRKVVGIDDPQVKQLLSALQAGNFVEDACDFAGIAKSTVYRWLDRGLQESDSIAAGEKPNKNERVYLELWDAIKSARAEAKVRNVAIIQNAAKNGTWQAAAWWLERTAPQQYGRRLSAEISGEDGGAIKVVTVNALEAKIAALMGDVDESVDSEIPDTASA
jgi:hypothetical protein